MPPATLIGRRDVLFQVCQKGDWLSGWSDKLLRSPHVDADLCIIAAVQVEVGGHTMLVCPRDLCFASEVFHTSICPNKECLVKTHPTCARYLLDANTALFSYVDCRLCLSLLAYSDVITAVINKSHNVLYTLQRSHWREREVAMGAEAA